MLIDVHSRFSHICACHSLSLRPALPPLLSGSVCLFCSVSFLALGFPAVSAEVSEDYLKLNYVCCFSHNRIYLLQCCTTTERWEAASNTNDEAMPGLPETFYFLLSVELKKNSTRSENKNKKNDEWSPIAQCRTVCNVTIWSRKGPPPSTTSNLFSSIFLCKVNRIRWVTLVIRLFIFNWIWLWFRSSECEKLHSNQQWNRIGLEAILPCFPVPNAVAHETKRKTAPIQRKRLGMSNVYPMINIRIEHVTAPNPWNVNQLEHLPSVCSTLLGKSFVLCYDPHSVSISRGWVDT